MKNKILVLSLGEAQLARVEAYAARWKLDPEEAAGKLLELSLSRLDTLARDQARQAKQRSGNKCFCSNCEVDSPLRELTRRENGARLCASCLAEAIAEEAPPAPKVAPSVPVKAQAATRVAAKEDWLCKTCQTPFRASAGIDDCNTCPRCVAKTAPAKRQQAHAPVDPSLWQKRGMR